MTRHRSGAEAQRIVRESLRRAGKQPRRWITDGLQSYNKAESDLRGNGKIVHIKSKGFTEGTNNMIERFHGTVKERTKVMRGLRDGKTAGLLAKGYRIYYNFVRPHKALRGLTPAEAAGLPRGKTRNRWLGILQDRTAENGTDRAKQFIMSLPYLFQNESEATPNPAM